MKILIVSSYFPMPDRASGELRFLQLLKMLAERYEIFFISIAQKTQFARIGEKETKAYRASLESLGVTVVEGGVVKGLKDNKFAAVFFEFWRAALPHITSVRTHQPHARIIIDSVDVTYHRLFSKARLTGLPQDLEAAEARRAEELSIYRDADITITVTDEDADVLHTDDSGLKTVTIPNIHEMHEPIKPGHGQRKSLIFIGNYKHEPNVDAVHYLCDEIWPYIVKEIPDVRLRIIGNAPPESIVNLSSVKIEVLGYVPQTGPYLESSGISLAPLRFGAGMKGKIGEAMSYGVPVVTTTVGVEGFGLTPGVNVLLGDAPEEFAGSVIRLIDDEQYYDRIRMSGYHFIAENYSEPAVRKLVYNIFDNLESFPVKKSTSGSGIFARILHSFRQHFPDQ